jgi:hypothetical protein
MKEACHRACIGPRASGRKQVTEAALLVDVPRDIMFNRCYQCEYAARLIKPKPFLSFPFLLPPLLPQIPLGKPGSKFLFLGRVLSISNRIVKFNSTVTMRFEIWIRFVGDFPVGPSDPI